MVSAAGRHLTEPEPRFRRSFGLRHLARMLLNHPSHVNRHQTRPRRLPHNREFRLHQQKTVEPEVVQSIVPQALKRARAPLLSARTHGLARPALCGRRQ